MTRRTYRLGVTGSIGMGKSTTAALFAAAGVPVWDADAAVHRAYAPGGGGAAAIAALAPNAVKGGAVDRERLRGAILDDPGLLEHIEAAVHPLAEADQAAFLAAHEGVPLAVLDIPLLYETGADAWLDGVLVVTAPAGIQRGRVLDRPGMTEAAFARILARQTPDAEKRARADFLIATDKGVDHARAAVLDLVRRLTGEAGDA